MWQTTALSLLLVALAGADSNDTDWLTLNPSNETCNGGWIEEYRKIFFDWAEQDEFEFPHIEDTARFFIIGDWGYGGSSEQLRTADVMSELAALDGLDFILNVGDNFYWSENSEFDGVASVTDRKWRVNWLYIYLTSRKLDVPWFSVLGNHDWKQNPPDAQIDYFYYKNGSDSWVLPNFFYNMHTTIGPSKAKAAFIQIDTNLLAYSYEGETAEMSGYFQDHGWTPERRTAERQLEYIEAQLAAHIDADWLFVTGHHPLASCGGSEKMEELLEMFDRYNVTAYFAGHVHCMHFSYGEPEWELDENGYHTAYIVSGAGGGLGQPCSGYSQFTVAGVAGFVSAELNGTSLNLRYISEHGDTLYRVPSIKPRPKAATSAPPPKASRSSAAEPAGTKLPEGEAPPPVVTVMSTEKTEEGAT